MHSQENSSPRDKVEQILHDLFRSGLSGKQRLLLGKLRESIEPLMTSSMVPPSLSLHEASCVREVPSHSELISSSEDLETDVRRDAQAPRSSEMTAVQVDADMADLVPRYLINRAHELMLLRELFVQEDWKTIERIGHGLKGSGTAYGFRVLTDLGSKLEISSRESDKGSVEECIHRIDIYLKKLMIDGFLFGSIMDMFENGFLVTNGENR